jgi:hypothetical protein
MDRRTFNKLLGTATLGGVAPGFDGVAQARSIDSAGDVKFSTQWPQQVYRRLLVDTHIPDWDPLFLSRFDSAEYVDTISRAVRVLPPSGQNVTGIYQVPDRRAVKFETAGAYKEFRLEPFEMFTMLLVEYE